jgi:putative membrane protein
MSSRMYRAACSAAVFGILTFSAASAQDHAKSGSGAGGADQHFAMEAAQGGMAEVQLGNLAKDHASGDAVKQFGQKMVDDHSKANDQLKSVASQSGVTLPTDIGAKHQAELDRLSKLNGAAFDRAYMQLMVRDHRKDVADFQKEANSGKDANLKKFASETLPTLQMHLQMAQQAASGNAGAHSGSGSSSEHGGHDKK